MKNKYVFVAFMLSVILLVSFGLTNIYVSQNESAEEDFVVVTSFYPMYIATMNVIGDTEGVTLKNLSEPQTGCLHDFQLTPEDMKLLSKADVFIINGGGIESFMEEIAKQYPELVIIEACEGMELLCEEHEHEEEEEEHVHEEAHNHDVNAHAWMSVELYRMQIQNITEGLIEADPVHGEAYLANQALYDGKLSKLQEQQEELQLLLQDQSAIMFHCAYDYIAMDYGLDVAFCMDLDEERQVSAGEIAEVLGVIESEKVSYIFAEELYATSICTMIQEEVDVHVVYLDPLTRGEYEADSYIQGMSKNMELIKEAFTDYEKNH